MIFENAPVGIFQISPGGTIIKANQRLADMIGLNHPDEIAGKSFEIVSHLHDKGFDEMRKMVDEAGEITGREAEIINSDGSKVVVMKSIRAVRDEKGQVQ